MQKPIVTMFLLALLPMAATAGDHSGQGYVFYGPGWVQGGGGTHHIGGGGEAFLYRGLTAGAEIGYIAPFEGFTYGVGLFSANGGYHLNRSSRSKFSPFITAGYSLAFRQRHESLFNFGGGLTWWAADHLGLRVEFRDYIWPEYSAYHAPQVRFAVAFR